LKSKTLQLFYNFQKMKKLFFLLSLVFVFTKSEAQWTQGGNDGAQPELIFDLDSFQLTLNNFGIYKSINNGLTWYLIPCPAVQYVDLLISNGRILASSDKGIFVSDDYGNTWTASNSGIVSPGNVNQKSILHLPNNEILYSNGVGLYKSTTNGNSWTAISTGPTSIRNIVYETVNNLLVCATQTGIQVSNDLGQNWVMENTGLTSLNLMLLEYLNGVWVCGSTNSNIFVSQNNSFQWSLATGLTGIYINPRILVANNQLLANRTTGVHVYNFNTAQFELSALNQSFLVAISQGLNQVFYGGEIVSNKPDYYNSTYTNDFGLTWNFTRGLRNSAVLGFSQLNNDKLSFNYAGAGCYSAYLDSSYYIIGAPYVFGSTSANISNSLKYQNQKFYCATNSGIWISNDSAQTWVQQLSGLPATQPGNYHYVYDLEVFGDTIIAGTPSGPYISTNGGISFSISNFPGATTSYDLLYHNGKLYSGGSPKMLVSSDLGANWSQFGSTTDVFQQMAASGPYIYSASDQSIYLTIDSIGTTTNITGNLDPFIGIGNNPGIAAYDSLLFVSNFFRVGVHKMNINQPGVFTDISHNLPVYEETPGFFQYPYLSFAGKMTIFDNKLWLGTAGMSCFTRPLSDFGYPPVVVTDSKKSNQKEINFEVKIYPNPFSEELNLLINCKDQNPLLIEINNISGELVYQQSSTVSSGILKINLASLNSGLYLVKLSDAEGNMKAVKFVKQ
jgi:hypothetical protein